MGQHDLCAGLCGAADQLWSPRRHQGTQTALPHRHRDIRRCEHVRRAVRLGLATDSGQTLPGGRRCDHPAHHPVLSEHALYWQVTRNSVCSLGFSHRWHGSYWPATRWLAHHLSQLAMGVLYQLANRSAGARAVNLLCSRNQRPFSTTRRRPRRLGPDRGRASRTCVCHDRGSAIRLDSTHCTILIRCADLACRRTRQHCARSFSVLGGLPNCICDH
ncbi:unannotated protein [freshwater metagenome]|uniref:Unannotated protein n=1 Tax=freshwater metagenome TaxID=449393 RepID=A0A6J6PYW2_9ZZZZ